MRSFLTIALAVAVPLVGVTALSGSSAAAATPILTIDCTIVLCAPGLMCVDTKNGPTCVPFPPPPPPK